MAVFAPPAKLPLAPLLGGVNVTVTPFTGVPLTFVTVTTKGAKGVLMAALCGVPLVALIADGGPCVFVNAKLADPVIPTALPVAVELPGVPYAVTVAEAAT